MLLSVWSLKRHLGCLAAVRHRTQFHLDFWISWSPAICRPCWAKTSDVHEHNTHTHNQTKQTTFNSRKIYDVFRHHKSKSRYHEHKQIKMGYADDQRHNGSLIHSAKQKSESRGENESSAREREKYNIFSREILLYMIQAESLLRMSVYLEHCRRCAIISLSTYFAACT